MKACLAAIRFLSLAALVSCASAAGLDQYLVARWTFNGGQLKADVGGCELKTLRIGGDPSVEFADGSVSLGPGALLVCDKINSRDHPELKTAVTIWARVRIDAAPAMDGFLFGLRNEEPAADWKNMILAVMDRPKPANATGFFATLGHGAQLGSGSRFMVVTPGRFVSLALVFDGASKSVTYLVDGKPLEGKHRDAVSLADFNNFAIGRLKQAAGLPMTVDEVRIYSVALSPEWVADITPVK